MAPIPAARFRKALGSLDESAFVAFLEDLYRRRGWTVERDGTVLVVDRDGVSKRVLVLPPRRFPWLRAAPDAVETADEIATAQLDPAPRDLPRGTPDCDVVDAATLRQRALYGLSKAACSDLFATHLDVPARGERWEHRRSPGVIGATRVAGRRIGDLVAGDPVGRPTLQAPGVVGVLLVAAGVLALAGAHAAVLGAPVAFDDPLEEANERDAATIESTPSSGELNGLDPGGRESSDGASDGADDADPIEDVPSPPPGADAASTAYADGDWPDGDRPYGADGGQHDGDVYDVEPTCERSPVAVAENVSAALTGGEQSAGLHVFWQFSTPSTRETIRSYDAYVSVTRHSLEDVFYAEDVHHESAAVDDGLATVPVTVVTDRGYRQSWEYRLQHVEEEPYEGCWMIERFERV